MVELISADVAQAIADVAHLDPTLVFDAAELVIIWPSGIRIAVTIDEDTPTFSYSLAT